MIIGIDQLRKMISEMMVGGVTGWAEDLTAEMSEEEHEAWIRDQTTLGYSEEEPVSCDRAWELEQQMSDTEEALKDIEKEWLALQSELGAYTRDRSAREAQGIPVSPQDTVNQMQSLISDIDEIEEIIEDELENFDSLKNDYLEAYEESPACWDDDYLDDEEYDENAWKDTDDEFLSGNPRCDITSVGGPTGSYKLCEPYEGVTCKSTEVDDNEYGPEGWCFGWEDSNSGEDIESIPDGPRWRRVRI